jgi:hypothetical protein
MPSQWNRLCEILELAQSMPAKSKSAYVKSALTALALECHAKVKSARALRAMPSKMKRKTIGHKANGQKSRKKRRTADLSAPAAAKYSDVRK